MDDLISKRSATERLIIAKTLLETVLQDMPTAEPEIIRCCKCVHWKQDTVRQNSNDVSWWNEAVCDKYSDDIWTVWKDADWYCADAERRSDV